MAKLTMVGSRISAASRSPLASVGGRGPERDRARAASNPWRALYSTARWQRLVRRIRRRDGMTCRQTGVLLAGDGRKDLNGPVVDHIIPAHVFWWDGRRELFWDEDNLQLVSKQWHDRVKQAEERLGRYAGR